MTKQAELFKHKIEVLTRDLEDINLKSVVSGLEEKEDSIISMSVLCEEDNTECAEHIIISFFDEDDTLVDKIGMPYFEDLPEHIQEIILKENTQEI